MIKINEAYRLRNVLVRAKEEEVREVIIGSVKRKEEVTTTLPADPLTSSYLFLHLLTLFTSSYICFY